MDDLISRESVKEILNSNALPYHVVPNVWDAINQLPSTQPEIKQQAINSSDCIDRQAALDAIRPIQTYKLFEGDDMLLIDKAEVQTELMMLPSAQLDTYWKEQCQSYEQTINKLRESLTCDDEFCPHCGAKMEVTE